VTNLQITDVRPNAACINVADGRLSNNTVTLTQSNGNYIRTLPGTSLLADNPYDLRSMRK